MLAVSLPHIGLPVRLFDRRRQVRVSFWRRVRTARLPCMFGAVANSCEQVSRIPTSDAGAAPRRDGFLVSDAQLRLLDVSSTRRRDATRRVARASSDMQKMRAWAEVSMRLTVLLRIATSDQASSDSSGQRFGDMRSARCVRHVTLV